MKKLLEPLVLFIFNLRTSNKGVVDCRTNPTKGFYGIMFRNLDWDVVKAKLETIESKLPEDWEYNLSLKGDEYQDRYGKTMKVQKSFLWISKDQREDQTQESIMDSIPE